MYPIKVFHLTTTTTTTQGCILRALMPMLSAMHAWTLTRSSSPPPCQPPFSILIVYRQPPTSWLPCSPPDRLTSRI
ncbi:hypothetical protein BDV32DRAFT_125932 [Aspergillus pseudonomiae]|uniref:Uncharacterized protein n=1 Tax=Aspergillus pseudonomiae TaxID=1506151 RepID=A0A5N7DQU7_9EURO|nr:uncharacterized protein BDV37DRAFT_240279 [Aspergillus pseudonomiae]KAB8258338.1 hypothetical protein BDV32DRAFT_125932 [Aspergillus pseudonomiae]KAE8407878.1 hypothetical protein BDV37DRAFT_240279 [Aspergillus pseudonomiae]